MKLRVLCLHDESSSALSLIGKLKQLGERLHTNHNIELAFINSPHIVALSNIVAATSNSEEGNDTVLEDEDIKRVWFHENQLGLDASILHLKQIWSQSLYSNPFSGVLGIGQGAAITGLMPFLRYETPLDDEQDYGMMFEGLEFCIFVNGWDLLSQNEQNGHDEYDEAKGIPSLHIYPEHKGDSHHLFQRYGGEVDGSKSENLITESTGTNMDAKAMNAIGKFLLAQKKSIIEQHRRLATIDRERIEANGEESNEEDAVLTIEATRMELARVELEALDLINKTVAANPPKALMAMIMPDSTRGGTMVGGWSGERDAFRSEEFIRSGGAPCPKEFTLPAQDREQQS